MMKEFFKKYYSYFFVLALFIGITAPALWSDGMFMDGTIYAVISRNLAEGFGTFWSMKFSEIIMNPFYGHPPLVFYSESLGFRIFGDSIYVERIYSFITGLVAIVLIIVILKSFIKNRNKSTIIISLLVWLSFPLVNWAYSNNMLENTVTVFTLLSFLFLIKSYDRNRFRMLFLSGIFLFAGFLSKGFTALFILSVPFLYWFVYRKISFYRMITNTLFFFVFTALPFILIYRFSEGARVFFEKYFNEQIIGSIKNAVTVNSRFFIAGSMLNEMIIPVIFTVFLFILLKIKKIKPNFGNENLKNALFFFLISLSGIFPMMIRVIAKWGT
ncbi:MAG: glycosyltransferase family 39 protein [Bacteroidales bacterium]|nr:glycosyltransferase family 39 protein [Bacteroidales bacterium]